MFHIILTNPRAATSVRVTPTIIARSESLKNASSLKITKLPNTVCLILYLNENRCMEEPDIFNKLMVSQLKSQLCVFFHFLLNVRYVLNVNFQGDTEKLLRASSLDPIWHLSQSYRLFIPCTSFIKYTSVYTIF